MLLFVINASLLLSLTTSAAENEACTIPSILNGTIGKYIKVRFSRKTAFKKLEEGTEVKPDEDVYLHCSKGYEIPGSNLTETKIICNEGSWSHELQCSPASCHGDAPLAFFGKVREVEVNREHGGSILYECVPDHDFVRNGSVTCEYGEWIGWPPTCRSLKCPTKSLKMNGVVIESNQIFYENETYNYTCESPRYEKPEGHPGLATCKDGAWHLVLPLCVEIRCYLEDLENLMHISPDSQPITLGGETLNVTCEDGYSLSGELPICDNRKWNRQLDEPLCKESICYLKDLENVMNISPESQATTSSGETLNVTCEDGYTLSGELPICDNGVWNGQLDEPLCKESRCHLKDLGNVMNISPDSQPITLSGETLTVICDDGYSLSGELPFCENGMWNQQLYEPLCKRSRCYIKDVGNLMNHSPETDISTLSGKRLNVVCVEGYSVKGEIPMCENGKWSKYLYESPCEENTCQVPYVPNGRLKVLISQESDYSFWQFKYPSNRNLKMITPGTTILPNTVLYLCCNNGYSFRGNNAQMVETQCFRGRWLPYPECQRHMQHRKGIYRDTSKFKKPWDVFE